MDSDVITIIVSAVIVSVFSVGVIFRFWAKSKIDQWFQLSLKKSQHELDVKKDSLQADLSIYVHEQNAKYSKFNEAKRAALEKIYAQIVATEGYYSWL